MSNPSLPTESTQPANDADSTAEIKNEKMSDEEPAKGEISSEEEDGKYSQGIQLALVALALVLAIFLVSLDMVCICD